MWIHHIKMLTMLGEDPEVGVGHQAMPVLASVSGSDQPAEQLGISKEERPEQRAVHDGEEVGACQVVRHPGALALPQGLQ